MLVLFETAMGYCLFKVTDTNKIESADLWKEFENPEKANKLYAARLLRLKCFGPIWVVLNLSFEVSN